MLCLMDPCGLINDDDHDDYKTIILINRHKQIIIKLMKFNLHFYTFYCTTYLIFSTKSYVHVRNLQT